MSPVNRSSNEERNLITTDAGDFSYRLTRSSKRKRTMQVSVHQSGSVDVTAPFSFSVRTIEDFLRHKSGWITRKVKLFKEREAQRINRVSQGLTLLYLGKEYPVVWQVSASNWGKIDFNDQGWRIEIPARIDPAESREFAKGFLEKWYKSRAQAVIEQRVKIQGERMGDLPSRIHIRSPKRLWGSCHPVKRVVHFNWKLIMAPVDVLDYVVIHELSHLKVADHSRRFWSLVEKFSPEHGMHKQWLRQYAHRFVIDLE